MSTLYARMPDLLMSREEDLAAGIPESKILKKHTYYRVLVVDEWLMDPLNPDQMRFFLELVDRRHDKSSTTWRSQHRVEDWRARLDGGTHADAIMDGMVHNAVTLLTGEVNMRGLMSPKSQAQIRLKTGAAACEINNAVAPKISAANRRK